jgi:hypothetical protein
VLEMPTLPALPGAQVLGPFGARQADAGYRVPAGHQHRLSLARGQVGPPELDLGGRTPPCSTARSLTTSRAAASTAAQPVSPYVRQRWSLSITPVLVVAELPSFGVAAGPAFDYLGWPAMAEQDQPRSADRACLVRVPPLALWKKCPS